MLMSEFLKKNDEMLQQNLCTKKFIQKCAREREETAAAASTRSLLVLLRFFCTHTRFSSPYVFSNFKIVRKKRAKLKLLAKSLLCHKRTFKKIQKIVAK